MKTTVFGITFASWHYWWVFIIYAIIVIFIVHLYRHKKKVIKLLAAAQHRTLLLPMSSYAKLRVKALLLIIGFLFLALAALQPQWGMKEEIIEQQGRDLLIALDISRSMLAQDIKPDRLTYAKEKIKKLVSMLASERVGLLLFSGDAFVQCPLTKDKQAFISFLDQVDAQTISSGSTAIDKALAKALGVFERMKDRKHKLLVMFTDGEDFSHDLATLKKDAQEINMRIFTLGVGTPEGAPVPMVNEEGTVIGHEKDSQGNVVISHLNEGILQALSHDVGGMYIPVQQTDADVKTVVKLVEHYEKEAYEDSSVIKLEERYPLAVALSFFCFLMDWLL